MPTSSIFEPITIDNPKVMIEYVAALERAENAPVAPRRKPHAEEIRDPKVLKELMLKGIEKWGKIANESESITR